VPQIRIGKDARPPCDPRIVRASLIAWTSRRDVGRPIAGGRSTTGWAGRCHRGATGWAGRGGGCRGYVIIRSGGVRWLVVPFVPTFTQTAATCQTCEEHTKNGSQNPSPPHDTAPGIWVEPSSTHKSWQADNLDSSSCQARPTARSLPSQRAGSLRHHPIIFRGAISASARALQARTPHGGSRQTHRKADPASRPNDGSDQPARPSEHAPPLLFLGAFCMK
jgi:hypothetical protein